MMHDAALPGGPLSKDGWFLSSLAMHDFLIAGMIVYLCLNQTLEAHDSGQASLLLDPRQQNMIDSLRRSHNIWSKTENASIEIKKLKAVLSVILEKLELALARFPGLTDHIQSPPGSIRNEEASVVSLSIHGM